MKIALLMIHIQIDYRKNDIGVPLVLLLYFRLTGKKWNLYVLSVHYLLLKALKFLLLGDILIVKQIIEEYLYLEQVVMLNFILVFFDYSCTVLKIFLFLCLLLSSASTGNCDYDFQSSPSTFLPAFRALSSFIVQVDTLLKLDREFTESIAKFFFFLQSSSGKWSVLGKFFSK